MVTTVNDILDGLIVTLDAYESNKTKNLYPFLVKELLSDKIDELNLPLPMRELSLDDSCQDFENLLNFDESTILVDQPFFTRYDYEYPLSEKVIKTVSIGNKSSDYFHQETSR